MPPPSASSTWRRPSLRSRPRSGATPTFWSSPAHGFSARATRSGLSRSSSMSERYAVIGHPVAHSKSPFIHAEFARATRQDIEYRRIEAPLDGFRRTADEFRAAGGKGLNVTLPFKGQAFVYCAQASDRARASQAVNTLDFREPTFGDNTDGVGLVRDLSRNLHFDLRSSRALLMGAGGAAQGVVGALREAGVAQLVIVNRTVAKAQAVAARFPRTRACG